MDMIDDIFPLPIAVSSVSNLFNFFYFCTFLPRIVASAHLRSKNLVFESCLFLREQPHPKYLSPSGLPLQSLLLLLLH